MINISAYLCCSLAQLYPNNSFYRFSSLIYYPKHKLYFLHESLAYSKSLLYQYKSTQPLICFRIICYTMHNDMLYKVVGLLRASWFDQSKKLILSTYGTAFAISNQILITCTHNIFSEQIGSPASEVIFIPNVSKEKITPRTQTYKSYHGHFWRLDQPKTLVNKQPIKEELALVLLQTPIQTSSFLKLGSIEPDQINNDMKIVGYPSKNYMTSQYLLDVQVDRYECDGKLYQKSVPNTHILRYTIPTSVGVSGSPIFMKDTEGYYKIVGVHTHRGLTNDYNSGLYFDKSSIEKISQWTKQLQQQFKKVNNSACESNFRVRKAAQGLRLEVSQMLQPDEEYTFEKTKFIQNEQTVWDKKQSYEQAKRIYSHCAIADEEQSYEQAKRVFSHYPFSDEEQQFENQSVIEGDYDLYEEDYNQSRHFTPFPIPLNELNSNPLYPSEDSMSFNEQNLILSTCSRSFHYGQISMIFQIYYLSLILISKKIVLSHSQQ